MKLERAVSLIGGKKGNQRQLADALGIDKSAVSKWNPEKIPKLREMEVNEIVAKRKAKRSKKTK